MALVLQRNGYSPGQFLISTASGGMWSWGENNVGQLGQNSTTTVTTPQAVPGGPWSFADGSTQMSAAISLGKLYTCGQYQNLGYASGSNVKVFTQVGTDTDWVSASVGEVSGYAVKTGGALYVWGDNSSGQLGLGDTTRRDTPTVTSITTASVVRGSSYYCIVLTAAGTLHAAGNNVDGRLGLGHYTTPITSFTQIGALSTWTKVSAGYGHVAAIKGGELWTWGYNASGQLGQGDTTTRNAPTQVGVGTTWVDVACGESTTYALKSDGTVWACGENSASQCVVGDTTDKSVLTQVGVATTWDAIYGSYSSLFVMSGDDLWCGGQNQSALLGLGDSTQRPNLVQQTYVFATVVTEDVVQSATVTSSASESVDIYRAQTEAADGADAFVNSTFTMYLEAIGLSDSLAVSSNTTTTYADGAAMLDVIQQAINQIAADSAAGADSLTLGAALALVDIADAAAVHAPSYNSVMLVAELIATLEAYNSVASEDIAESGVLSDAYVARVEALVAMLETAQVVDTNTALIHVMQLATDSADGAETITSTGSLINALLSDAALATIRLNIGGELFTGWVLNTDTLAPSEYQFADRQFNSACKHGDRYLMAADDGIYQFTDEADVETVMTYIKTGKTDFGSGGMRTRVEASYMVYSATGNMTLKVTTSENGALQTNNYTMVPFAANETQDAKRSIIGKGIKSRYWQFELTGANAGCEFDEIGMLPVILSRRI